jgi:hypothetical protein
MFYVMVFNIEADDFLVKSRHRTELAGLANFEVAAATGVPVRLIYEGKTIRFANTDM